DRVLKVQVWRISFATNVHRTVDAALRANAVAALDRNQTKQFHSRAGFCKLHGGHQPGKPTTHNHNRSLGHFAELTNREVFIRMPNAECLNPEFRLTKNVHAMGNSSA